MGEESETLEVSGQDDGENLTEANQENEVEGQAVLGVDRKLWNWLDGYVEYTEDWEPPGLFNKWCGLLALSIATQRKVWLEEANSKIYPNLFVVLVAPSGVGKTSAMREVLPFIEAAIGPEHISPAKITAAKLSQRFAAAQKHDAVLGVHTPYLICAEELPSFLGMDAYKSGMIADLTTWYDCPERWAKETKNKGEDDIVKPYPCMLAGTTAQGIFDVLPPGSVTQGFTARLIFVHAGYASKRVVEKPWQAKHAKLHVALFHDIQVIAQLQGAAKFSDYARTLWTDYYLNRPTVDQEFTDTRLQGYASRKPFYVKKLALLLSLAEGNALVVEAAHVERALAILAELDVSLQQIYGEISPSVVIQHYGKIVKKLKQARQHKMVRADLQRAFSYSLDGREFQQAMDALGDMGLVEMTWEDRTAMRQRAQRWYALTDAGKRWI